MMWGNTPVDRRKFVGGAAAGLGAGLAGCGDQTGDGESTDTEGTDAQGTATDGETQTPENPPEGGTLVLGQTNDLQSYNVLTEGNFFGLVVLLRIYDIGLSANPNTDRPIPGVFQDWEINLDNFGTDEPAVVGEMIQGHTFHDGEEVTAGDVAFTHRYEDEQNTAGPYQTPANYEGVEADSEDGYTVSWFFSNVTSDAFLSAMGEIILPSHIWRDVPDYTQYNPYAEGELIGSGPFEIDEANEGEFYQLKTRPKEDIPWNGMEQYPWLHPEGPFIDGVRFDVFQSQGGLFQSLLDGEIHMGIGSQPINQAVQASQQDNLTVMESGEPGWTMLMYNTRRVPFDDVAFRQFMRKCYNQRWTVENQLQNIAGAGGEYLVAKPWEFWRPPEVEELLAEADSDDVYATTQYVNEEIADEDIVEPIDIPNLKYPTGNAEWPSPDQAIVDELRNFLLEHPKAKHDYSLGEATSSGTRSIDGQEIYVNGEPLGTAHTNNQGQPGEGPIEFDDYPPNQAPQSFERMTKWIETVQAAGLPTTRETQPWAQTQPKVYQEEDFDVMTQSWPSRVWHATHLVWMLSGVGDNLDADSSQSATNWNGSGYTGADELVAEQDRFVDPERRQPWVKQALAQIYHDQPQSVAVYPKSLQAVDNSWEGHISAVGGVFNDATLLNIRQVEE